MCWKRKNLLEVQIIYKRPFVAVVSYERTLLVVLKFSSLILKFQVYSLHFDLIMHMQKGVF